MDWQQRVQLFGGVANKTKYLTFFNCYDLRPCRISSGSACLMRQDTNPSNLEHSIDSADYFAVINDINVTTYITIARKDDGSRFAYLSVLKGVVTVIAENNLLAVKSGELPLEDSCGECHKVRLQFVSRLHLDFPKLRLDFP